MVKIKGWKKTGKYSYRRDSDNAFLQIGQPINKVTYRVLIEILPKRKLKPIHEGVFYSEKEAKKFAIDYMIKHPKN